MNWDGEFDYWRERLRHIVAMMLALAGIDDEFPIARSLPRYAYRAIMLILKPAESAVRRLIIVAASKLTVEVRARRAKSPSHTCGGGVRGGGRSGAGSVSPPPAAPLLPSAIRGLATSPTSVGGGAPNPVLAAPIMPGASAITSRTPAFQLTDPRKHFDWLYPDEDAANDRQSTPNLIARPSPDLPTIDDYLIPPDRLCERLGFKRTIAPKPGDYEPIATTRLSLRLRALKAALDDIPGQALRLASLQARSKLEPTSGKQRHLYLKRPGVPPGHRKRRIHRIDEILADCHKLALRALEQPRPDTS